MTGSWQKADDSLQGLEIVATACPPVSRGSPACHPAGADSPVRLPSLLQAPLPVALGRQLANPTLTEVQRQPGTPAAASMVPCGGLAWPTPQDTDSDQLLRSRQDAWSSLSAWSPQGTAT